MGAERSFVFATREGQVTIFDEPTYSFGSVDNLRTYDAEIRLDSGDISSVHGVRANGKWSAVFAASGGATTVHQHSAIEIDSHLYLAIGARVVCLSLVTGSRRWSRQVDPATCFGIYWDCRHNALLSHGELQISRLSVAGNEIWTATGADIFSEGFRCLDNGIEVIDFNRSAYLFDYRTGTLLAANS